MKSRVHKTAIRNVLNGRTGYVPSEVYCTTVMLVLARVLHEQRGFGPQRINELFAGTYEFLQREDLTTLYEELTYWADKYGINY